MSALLLVKDHHLVARLADSLCDHVECLHSGERTGICVLGSEDPLA